MRIAYVTTTDPRDRRSWSGTVHYMARALERNVGEVVPLGPLWTPALPAMRIGAAGVHALTGRRFAYKHSVALAKRFAREAERLLARERFDLVAAPAGSSLVSFLPPGLPVLYSSDATFDQVRDYYPEFSRLFARSVRHGNELERRAIARARWLLYPSPWVADFAQSFYAADPARIHVVPYGANLDDPPSAETASRLPGRDTCNLLFIGVDWLRKGGDIAVATFDELVRAGIPARMTVVGCTPPDEALRPGIRVIPFLDKNVSAERSQLDALYADAHFLFVPTRRECYGIVFCEAASFGVPVVATDTGGVSGIVREGENGRLLPPEAGGPEYAKLIADLFASPDRYRALREGSRRAFDERLNWDAWGRATARILQGDPA
jgi:glycosyltransferase involved in cell wall biosynthesis